MNTERLIPSILRRATLVAVLALLACACANGLGPIGLEMRENGRFDIEWRRYLELAPHKSLAFAGDVEGLYVIGYGFDQITSDAAEFAAMRDCELRRADKRIDDVCRTVAVDAELIDVLLAARDVP
jgi:hypothetical protein